MEGIAKGIVIVFGLFIIAVGLLMLFSPAKAREILVKAASTPLIHFTEISIRMIPAAALILVADISRFPMAFQLLGWFMLVSSAILFFVPYKHHHKYALYWGAKLSPLMFRLISPVSMLFGGLLIYGVL